MKQLWDKTRDTWNNLSLNHRVLAVVVTLALLLAAGGTLRWAQQSTYTTLYTGLAPEEAGEIVDALGTMGVKHRLSHGGSAIMVPEDKAQTIRVKLASQGFPRGGQVGYEIFDQSNLGMTDFLQRVNFRRALEGEIAKSIMSLSEVAAARVHLVMPETRLFSRDQKQPTASVVLKLNRSLSDGQIAGIQHLVAASVEGLDTDHISLVDYRGKLLTDQHRADEGARLSNTQHEMRANVEQYLETKAQSMLDRTLGNGKAVVRVIADLNFDRVEKSAEVYDPDRVAIRSEETSSNKPGEEGTTGTETSAITNYEITKSVERVVSAYGTIDRLSVAVMVDGHYTPPAGGGGDAAPVYEPRTEEELFQLGAIVRTAVGFDSTRADHMEIVNLAFDASATDATVQSLDSVADYQMYYLIGKRVLYGLLILLGLFYLRKVLKSLSSAIKSASGGGRQVPGASAAEQVADMPGEPQRVRAADVFGERARGRPEEVAKIIKTMMAE